MSYNNSLCNIAHELYLLQNCIEDGQIDRKKDALKEIIENATEMLEGLEYE